MSGAWYPLDGTWHKSVASKLSALHAKRSSTAGTALCDDRKLLFSGDSYSESEAFMAGRTLCKRCLKAART